MYATHYSKPKSLAAAGSAYAEASEGKWLAGGMTLIPTMKQRLAAPDCLIDLAGLGLETINDNGDSLTIGAMATHHTVATAAVVRGGIPALAQLAGRIGDRQVRNRGTIGGSLANNDPAACYPAAVLALDGVVHTTERDILACDFFQGLFETALEEGEIITAVTLPKCTRAAYVKFPNPASRYALVGVFVACCEDGVRVAITGAGQDGVFRSESLESALNAEFTADSLASVALDGAGLMGDIHASADYRARLILALAQQAILTIVSD